MGVFKGRSGTDQHAWTREENEAFLKPNDESGLGHMEQTPNPAMLQDDQHRYSQRTFPGDGARKEDRLDVRETARLSLQFSILWVSTSVIVEVCQQNSLTHIKVRCRSRPESPNERF